jgi:hypothetical protein
MLKGDAAKNSCREMQYFPGERLSVAGLSSNPLKRRIARLLVAFVKSSTGLIVT